MFGKITKSLQIKESLICLITERTVHCLEHWADITHHWPFSKSKFKLKSDRVNLVAPASPIECLLYLANVRVIQYKLGLERLAQLGNSNVLRLPVIIYLNPKKGWEWEGSFYIHLSPILLFDISKLDHLI